MDTKTKLNEAAPDLEQQPLLPPPPPDTTADRKQTVFSPECELARSAVASPGTSRPTTVRTLALVTATVGLSFPVDLAARGEHPTLLAFAASFMIFCVSSSLFSWCQGRGKKEPPPPRAWPAMAPARVMFWSFAMSLVVSITCWAADRPRVPRAAGSALSALGVVVCWLCLAEIAPFFGRVTVQVAWGRRQVSKKYQRRAQSPRNVLTPTDVTDVE